MNIGIDAMGGDFAPDQVILGVQQFRESNPFVQVICIGNQAVIEQSIKKNNLSLNDFYIVDAPQVIAMKEHPLKAFRENPMSSIGIGFNMLAKNEIDAFVSAGNTGAMLVGSKLHLQTAEGLNRPALCSVVPKTSGNGVILDVGLNSDCRPENLNQFAVLGSLYAKLVLGIESPKIGLLNMGEEETKGNLLTQAAYTVLKQNTAIHFIGNIESRDLFEQTADVIVCDGYTGNIVLKMVEGFYSAAKQSNLHTNTFIQALNYEKHGGCPILGVSKPVLVGHGISNSNAFSKMLSLATELVLSEICAKISTAFVQ